MKSLLIMFLGLGIVLWGFFEMWNGGFAGAKYQYIIGGGILFAGMIVNHREHTRR